jgi:sugar phosphate permease
LGVGWFAGWISAVVGAQAFPILVQAYGLDNVFLIEAIICTIALFIQGIFMVESKGKSNTEIDELFYKRDNKLDQTLEPIMNS